MEIAMNLSPRRRHACALAATSVVAVAASLAAIPEVAFAQAFQGSGAVTSGTASITTGVGTTTITVASPEVVIDWQAIAPPTGNVDFLPAAAVATFQDAAAGVPLADYTVLNRIQPGNLDATGLFVPTARPIAFNGIVQSVLGGGTGGNIWFYSPNGIVVGSGAAFNTGSLVLTTEAIDTTGGLYGAGNTIRFRGNAGSTGFVNINAGARIGNGGKSAQYVAVVSPRVVQAGVIDVDGSVALVAAEQADISINAGLFDIEILAGSTDISGGPPTGSGIVHSGSTGGPASTGAADVQQIHFVSLAKNTSLTMLLSGSIGYAPAAVATNDGTSIILSAGPVSASQFNLAAGNNRILINPTVFSSFVSGYSSGFIDTDTAGGTIDFQAGADLYGGGGVFLTADVGRIHASNLKLTGRQLFYPVTSNFNGVDVDLIARQGGSIEIDNVLTIDVRGIDPNATLEANGASANGGDAGFSALTGGSITAGAIFADASGFGNGGTETSGDGFGGLIFLDVISGGSITAPIVDLTASGFGGTGILPTGALAPAGGYGRGGEISITNRGGSFTISDFTAVASAQSGLGSVSQGATETTGGGVFAYFDSGVQSFNTMTLTASATTFNQDNGRQAEHAIGGLVELRVDGVDTALTINGNLNLQANATTSVNSPVVPGDGAGFGEAKILVRNSGSLFVRGDTRLEANVGFETEGLQDIPLTTPNIFGGLASVSAESGGSIAVANLTAMATANGMGATSQAGSATGGTTTVGVITGGSFGASVIEGIAVVALDSRGVGDSGASPAHAIGGTATLFAQDGTVDIAGIAGVIARGQANVFSGFGANATGGTASAEVRAGANSLLRVQGLLVDSSGYAKDPLQQGLPSPDDAGNGLGGTATVVVAAGSLTSGATVVRANGLGGDGTAPAAGGSGTGGTARYTLADGRVSLGAASAEANGQGGTGGAGGNAAGGSASFQLIDTGAGPGVLRTVASLTLNANAEPGGPGSRSAGATALTVQPGAAASALAIAGNFTANSTGTSGAAGNGFTGSLSVAPLTIGGNATVQTTRNVGITVAAGSLFDVTGSLQIDAAGSLLSTGLIKSGGLTRIVSVLGLNMTNLESTASPLVATTLLEATGGAVVVSNSLLANNEVTAIGRSISINSLGTGELTVVSATATAGDLSITTLGGLVIDGASATGAVALASTDGFFEGNGPISGNSISIGAAGLASTSNLTATTTLDIDVGGRLFVGGLARAQDITITSSDIGIAGEIGAIGIHGTTRSITLNNGNTARPTFIGGGDVANSYSLSSAEMGQMFADQRIAINAPGTNPADVTLGAFDLNFGTAPGDLLAPGGELKIASAGRIAVTGRLDLNTISAADTFSIDPTRIDIITDTGGIYMLDPNGSPLGTLNLVGGTITVADSPTFSAIASATNLQAISVLLDTPTTEPNDAGFLQAGQINFDVTEGLFIQNTGTGTAFADRRGFTAGGVSISTSSAATQISINGVILDSAGLAITGLDTGGVLSINGELANRSGLFDSFSTLNGCIIGINCRFDHEDVIDLSEPGINKPLSPRGSDSNSLDLPIVGLVENEPEGSPPLVDEPVTGVGNDDLWQEECKEGEQCTT